MIYKWNIKKNKTYKKLELIAAQPYQHTKTVNSLENTKS